MPSRNRQESSSPTFVVVPGHQVAQVLEGREQAVTDLVEQTYRWHGEGRTVNPHSYFLRFPDRPSSRIIALPASIGAGHRLDGVKWISSFPGNVQSGLPRASAVLILNDPETGYPFACLESSIISASRTAASAALAADRLSGSRTGPGERPASLGIVGAGLIARYVHRYLARTGWSFDEIGVHDVKPEHAESLGEVVRGTGYGGPVVVHASLEKLVRSSDLIIFATVTPEPYVHDAAWFDHAPLILNVSLRDLSPEVVLGAANVVDDVDHCLTANTSVHLAEQQVGCRDFIDGTLHDVLTGRLQLPADRPVIFSPFGLGVLDLALGGFVHDRLAEDGQLTPVDGFFAELDRYGLASAPGQAIKESHARHP